MKKMLGRKVLKEGDIVSWFENELCRCKVCVAKINENLYLAESLRNGFTKWVTRNELFVSRSDHNYLIKAIREKKAYLSNLEGELIKRLYQSID